MPKWLPSFLLVLVSATVAVAQSGGTLFSPAGYDVVLGQARQSNRPVFVKIYLDGCPHCTSIDSLLASSRVGDFYNRHFLNVKIEANSDASKNLQTRYGITYPEFPLFLFFSPQGTLEHIATPHRVPDLIDSENALIDHGADALDPGRRASGYAPAFARGRRDPDFLIHYGKYAKTRRDTTALEQISAAFEQQLSTGSERESALGFYVLKQYVRRFDSALSRYFFEHLDTFRSSFGAAAVKEAGESILYHSLYGSSPGHYPLVQIREMRNQMIRLGVPAGEAAARTVFKEIEAALNGGQTREAVASFEHFRATYAAISLADFGYAMHLFNAHATASGYLRAFEAWVADAEKGGATQPEQARAMPELYYELAQAYHKAGLPQQATQTSEKALALATALRLDLAKYKQPFLPLTN